MITTTNTPKNTNVTVKVEIPVVERSTGQFDRQESYRKQMDVKVNDEGKIVLGKYTFSFEDLQEAVRILRQPAPNPGPVYRNTGTVHDLLAKGEDKCGTCGDRGTITKTDDRYSQFTVACPSCGGKSKDDADKRPPAFS